MYKTSFRGVLIKGNKNYQQVTSEILRPTEARNTPRWWYIAFIIGLGMVGIGAWALTISFERGVGMWGLNNNVGWGFQIINFVWWIGIGHAGTAFSIFLLILRQRWRTSLNRGSEAMTVFAVLCAGLFPLIHLGRVWNAFFILPYPNTRGPIWDNFNSPLFWDVCAISTYLLASAIFWYIGMIPDLAAIRDRATTKIKKAMYGFFSFGWIGNSRAWLRYETVMLILGGLTAPLVVSVHSIVSTDFATSVIPGWHETIFPPYFVIGAIFSGFAMVLTLMIIVRRVYKFQDFITEAHLEAITRILVFISLVMATAYMTEQFIAWYSGNPYEMFTFERNRVVGHYTLAWFTMVICNAIVPQVFWFKKLRNNITFVFIISLIINFGMWVERYVIIVTSLSKDFLPSGWAYYVPTIYEIAIFTGTIGLFLLGVLFFFRFIPMIAIHEVKGVLKDTSRTDIPPHGKI